MTKCHRMGGGMKSLHTFGHFSLFAIVMFFKVTVNTDFANTEPLLLRENTEFGSCKPHNIFFNRSLRNCFTCTSV